MKLSLNPLFKPHTSGCSSSLLKPHVTFISPHCSSTLNTHSQLNFNPQKFLNPVSLKISHGILDPIQPDPTRLADRWMEYQGERDWAGLLDPLDDNLRAEILRYGNFVEAAYRAFEFDPSTSTYGSCKYSKKHLFNEVGFEKLGYRLTCNLRATSGIQLPGWARSSWVAKQSSWIGYVAISHDKSEIKRLGRRDVVIAFRGTATCLEWLENLRATLAPITGPTLGSNGGPPMVETGFLSLYTSGSGTYPSLQETIRREVGRILELYPGEPISFTFTGHSLGAALATLAAHDIKTTFKRAHLVTVMSFGGPRVGNSSFRSLVEKQGTKILRMVNPGDLITKVPLVIENDDRNNMKNKTKKIIINNKLRKKEKEMHLNSKKGIWSNWIEKRADLRQWAYVEVGSELTLASQQQPKRPALKLNDIIDFVKSHDLKTYLNLVKGCSSRCPLRARARKLLNKPAVVAPNEHQMHDHVLNQTSPATT